MITCQFENGNQAKLRHVTMGTILVRKGQILLGKRGTYQGQPILESGKWSLLGGYLDRDENLIGGAKREVREESGWEIDNLILLRINDNPDRPHEDRQNLSFIYMAEARSQSPIETEEVKELQWFDVDNVPQADEWAFDHYDDFLLYKKYLQKPFPLPVLG
jgi:ADP-ribose pyrophosphatase YjhB (NUDIX family)